ncbi:hypothetical protein [Desulfogranum marinum]|uniref:hypothetical protein n=1 Tax=Desulfogranum marinum TaxID=453220 RepID=UPI0019622ACA|nr:hypothetical protein [Desulfogranum marinum]MBM9514186.1 hypothetical protein [Desulfogranum marinum]
MGRKVTCNNGVDGGSCGAGGDGDVAFANLPCGSDVHVYAVFHKHGPDETRQVVRVCLERSGHGGQPRDV